MTLTMKNLLIPQVPHSAAEHEYIPKSSTVAMVMVKEGPLEWNTKGSFLLSVSTLYQNTNSKGESLGWHDSVKFWPA